MTGDIKRPIEGAIRARFEEFDLADSSVVMISDPENEHAWIQSDLTVENHP